MIDSPARSARSRRVKSPTPLIETSEEDRNESESDSDTDNFGVTPLDRADPRKPVAVWVQDHVEFLQVRKDYERYVEISYETPFATLQALLKATGGCVMQIALIATKKTNVIEAYLLPEMRMPGCAVKTLTAKRRKAAARAFGVENIAKAKWPITFIIGVWTGELILPECARPPPISVEDEHIYRKLRKQMSREAQATAGRRERGPPKRAKRPPPVDQRIKKELGEPIQMPPNRKLPPPPRNPDSDLSSGAEEPELVTALQPYVEAKATEKPADDDEDLTSVDESPPSGNEAMDVTVTVAKDAPIASQEVIPVLTKGNSASYADGLSSDRVGANEEVKDSNNATSTVPAAEQIGALNRVESWNTIAEASWREEMAKSFAPK